MLQMVNLAYAPGFCSIHDTFPSDLYYIKHESTNSPCIVFVLLPCALEFVIACFLVSR
jgi:hypothetical protein